MIPSKLTAGIIYNYIKSDGTGIPLKYWYETLNYWCFTTVAEPQSIVLLHSMQIINNMTEIIR